MGSQLLEHTIKIKVSWKQEENVSGIYKVNTANKPVHKIQGYVSIKQFQDGNERQDPVNQKHPEMMQMQKK